MVFGLLLMGMFIPYQVVLVPLVRFLVLIGLYGTLPGIIWVHSIYGIPIAALIFRNYSALPTRSSSGQVMGRRTGRSSRDDAAAVYPASWSAGSSSSPTSGTTSCSG